MRNPIAPERRASLRSSEVDRLRSRTASNWLRRVASDHGPQPPATPGSDAQVAVAQTNVSHVQFDPPEIGTHRLCHAGSSLARRRCQTSEAAPARDAAAD
jgi:hypothetical protein